MFEIFRKPQNGVTVKNGEWSRKTAKPRLEDRPKPAPVPEQVLVTRRTLGMLPKSQHVDFLLDIQYIRTMK